MVGGDLPSSPRICTHPGCKGSIPESNWRVRYCERHRGQKWSDWRSRHHIVVGGIPVIPRSEGEIRVDLAELLRAQIRRFDSMVAHDRTTDPMR